MRKEKLGDRITALHQLVSPFGKVLLTSSRPCIWIFFFFFLVQLELIFLFFYFPSPFLIETNIVDTWANFFFLNRQWHIYPFKTWTLEFQDKYDDDSRGVLLVWEMGMLTVKFFNGYESNFYWYITVSDKFIVISLPC